MRSKIFAASMLLAGTTQVFGATPPAPPAPDTVVARVNGAAITVHDVQTAAANLPPELHNVPFQMIYPTLLNQLIDRQALTIQAKKEGLDKDPQVEAALHRVNDEVLQNALLRKDVAPQITEEAIQARYDRDYKNKTGEQEVHARHILVANEAQAKAIIAQLKAGAKFEDLAKKLSTDPGAQNGGDLGWFKRSDMVPDFANAAFAMKVGDVSATPVHTQFGWHVIKIEATRNAPVQSEAEMHDQIKEQLVQEGVKKVVASAKAGLKIEQFPLSADAMPVIGTPALGAAPATPAAH